MHIREAVGGGGVALVICEQEEKPNYNINVSGGPARYCTYINTSRHGGAGGAGYSAILRYVGGIIQAY